MYEMLVCIKVASVDSNALVLGLFSILTDCNLQ